MTSKPNSNSIANLLESIRSKPWSKDALRESANLTHEFDQTLSCLFEHALAQCKNEFGSAPSNVAIIAIGGFGRREMFPHTDIDMVLLYSGSMGREVEFLAKNIFYPLWDQKIEVGHSVQNISQAMKLAKKDFKTFSNFLDARFVAGNRKLAKSFVDSLFRKLSRSDRLGYLKRLLKDVDNRHERYGDTIYLGEPNIKEGIGGIRDLNIIFWIARSAASLRILSTKEKRDLNSTREFYSLTRQNLHHFAKRKHDRLDFQFQEPVAKSLGYVDSDGSRAVEKLLKDYYKTSLRVEYILDAVAKRCESILSPSRASKGKNIDDMFIERDGLIEIYSRSKFLSSPLNIMRLFYIAARNNLDISVASQQNVSGNLSGINDDYRNNPEVAKMFLHILRRSIRSISTLKSMHRTEFLDAYIPEFEAIRCLIQTDGYHEYTVDSHTLIAINEAGKLFRNKHIKDEPELTSIAHDIDDPVILILALLCHDIGKGRGAGHSERGAKIAGDIAARLGLSATYTERLKLLVREHLTMSNIAQRRNLSDRKVIGNFASLIGDTHNLNLLYLLTFADISGIGPERWTKWMSVLTRELYNKTRAFFVEGEVQEVGLAESQTVKNLEALLSKDNIFIQANPNPKNGFTELAVCVSKGTPGLFAKIAGAISANRVNILAANIYTSPDGHAVDMFWIEKNGEAVTDVRFLNLINKTITEVIAGNISLDPIFKNAMRGRIDKPIPRHTPPRVIIDTDTSDKFTVIEIYAYDRPGLLYELTDSIARAGLDISLAKISTKSDQVSDVFYVSDHEGKKIAGADRIREIQKQLTTLL